MNNIYCFIVMPTRTLTLNASTGNAEYLNLSNSDKLTFVLSNKDMSRLIAKTCFIILDTRSSILSN